MSSEKTKSHLSNSVTYITAPNPTTMVSNGNEVISFFSGVISFEFTSNIQVCEQRKGMFVKREDYEVIVGIFELLGLSFTTAHNAYFEKDLELVVTPTVSFRHNFKLPAESLNLDYRSILELFIKLKKEN